MNTKPDWFIDHELSDAERHGQLMSAIAQVTTRLDHLGESLQRVDARQWEERPSAVTTAPETPAAKRQSVSPIKGQTGMVAAMVGTMVVLGEIVKELVRALVAH